MLVSWFLKLFLALGPKDGPRDQAATRVLYLVRLVGICWHWADYSFAGSCICAFEAPRSTKNTLDLRVCRKSSKKSKMVAGIQENADGQNEAFVLWYPCRVADWAGIGASSQ